MFKKAFTLIEILVIIVILGVLAALLFPTVQFVREVARRSHCVNNQKNITIAMLNRYDQVQEIPPFRRTHRFEFDLWTGKPGFVGHYGLISWLFQLTPYLEANYVVDSFEKNNKREKFKLSFAHCPNRGIQEDNQISYVGNCGRVDGMLANPTGDTFIASDQTKNYGVMNDYGFNALAGTDHWQDNYGKILDFGDIKDGTSNTLFISENLQSGDFWNHDEFQVGFVYTSESDPSAYKNGIVTQCMIDCETFITQLEKAQIVYDSGQGIIVETMDVNRNTDNDEYWSIIPVLPINKCANNLDNHAYIWATARPSSYHVATIVAAFCDGSCRIVQENVAPKLFRQAMCPNDKIIGITSKFSSSDLD